MCLPLPQGIFRNAPPQNRAKINRMPCPYVVIDAKTIESLTHPHSPNPSVFSSIITHGKCVHDLGWGVSVSSCLRSGASLGNLALLDRDQICKYVKFTKEDILL
jgi:hypothetical protein